MYGYPIHKPAHILWCAVLDRRMVILPYPHNNVTQFSSLASTCILHSFSMRHDGDKNRCNPVGNVMATKLTFTSELFKWSTCSAGYLEQFRERGSTNCLHDTPGGNVMVFSATGLPGRNQNLTEQCKTSFGSTSTWHNKSQTPDVSANTHTHTHTRVNSMHSVDLSIAGCLWQDVLHFAALPTCTNRASSRNAL